MPYRLSMTLTGSAHGKVTVAATKPGDDKSLYYPLTADSLVYGAPDNSDYTPGKNAALTGGSTVTPNTKVTLTASTNDKAGTTTFIWQQLNADGIYTEVSS